MRTHKYLYKIIATELPDNGTLIRGRMFGSHLLVPMLLLFACIGYIFIKDVPYKIEVAAAIFAILLLMPFIARFRISVTASTVSVAIKYFGITVHKAEATFENTRVWGLRFAEINNNAYQSPEYEGYKQFFQIPGCLEFIFDDGYDGPFYVVSFGFNGKEHVFSNYGPKFEEELWQQIVLAFEKLYRQKGLLQG